jgi:hypothetical protein
MMGQSQNWAGVSQPRLPGMTMSINSQRLPWETLTPTCTAASARMVVARRSEGSGPNPWSKTTQATPA